MYNLFLAIERHLSFSDCVFDSTINNNLIEFINIKNHKLLQYKALQSFRWRKIDSKFMDS